MVKHFIAEALLGQILKQDDCFHHFISIRENGTEDQTSYICRHCFKHLDLFQINSQKGQNKPELCKKHYYYTTNPSSSCTHIFEAHCVYCQTGWMINISRQAGPTELLKKFMFNKDTNTQMNILLMFIFYLGNVVLGDKKPINSSNQKFQTFIGTGQTSLSLMDAFGYDLVDGYFQPKANLDNARLKRILQELSLEKDIISNGTTNSSIFRFSEATFVLAQLLGASVPFQQPPKEFLVSFADTVKKSMGPFYLLGVLTNTTDTAIIDCFNHLKSFDTFSIPRILDAITDITQAKKSAALEEFVLMERSRGMVGERELTSAYAAFGQGLSDETHPKQIIEVYRYLCTTTPQRMDDLMQALRVIASHRDCFMLGNFVSTGTVSFEDQDQMTLPAGLNNIGNTCYMNSLLQYYFSITNLREYVLAATYTKESTSDSECKSIEFVGLLKQLFMELIWSDSMSITPEKKLAEIILTTDKMGGFQFGEQQDLHECMDNILDMFEVALEKCVNKQQVGCSCTMLHQYDCLIRIFFGKTKQILEYQDEQGNPKVLEKVEPFHQLIVDVQPTLYEALDSYFNHHMVFHTNKVDFEKSKAIRRVDIINFPAILTIRVNRVQYDRTLMQTVKSNDFLNYQKTIYLERYSSEASPEIADKRKRMSEIQWELREARQSLLQLKTKQNYPDTPLNMLQQTVNIMHVHSQHVRDVKLLDTMQQHINGVRCQITKLEHKIGLLEQEKSSLFKDATKNEYHLFGVFLHEGEANFGHYWLLLYDAPGKRWLRYNDSVVTPVPEDQVFQDTTGKTFNAQSLIYVQSDQLEALTSVMVRNPEYRNKYPK